MKALLLRIWPTPVHVARWVLGLFMISLLVGVYSKQYWVLGLPVFALLALLFLYKHDYFYLLLFALTPLSVGLENFSDWSIGLYLPTEPLIVLSVGFLILKFWLEGSYPSSFLKHPFSKIIFLHLIWLFITSITSSMPLVSFKFLMVRTWYIFGFYYYMLLLLQQNPAQKMRGFLWFYLVPLLGVVIYTLIRLSAFKYDEKAAHWVMQPFFKDHTSYGAILAMMTPFLLAEWFTKKTNLNHKIFMFLFSSVFIGGLIFSYTRAAWISLLGAAALYLVLKFRISYKYLLGVAFLIGFWGFLNWDTLIMKLEKNKQDASKDLVEHVQSISNIASDASNLERINRWSCAWKMFLEKPLLGWGPGTYMFQYAPFQSSDQLTIISTNFGDGGNAHSEYLGPLSESGLFGLLSFLSVVIAFYFFGIRAYYQCHSSLKTPLMVILLGFTTYILHGFLNNYLDTDKASVLFWSFCAFITASDLSTRELANSAEK